MNKNFCQKSTGLLIFMIWYNWWQILYFHLGFHAHALGVTSSVQFVNNFCIFTHRILLKIVHEFFLHFFSKLVLIAIRRKSCRIQYTVATALVKVRSLIRSYKVNVVRSYFTTTPILTDQSNLSDRAKKRRNCLMIVSRHNLF